MTRLSLFQPGTLKSFCHPFTCMRILFTCNCSKVSLQTFRRASFKLNPECKWCSISFAQWYQTEENGHSFISLCAHNGNPFSATHFSFKTLGGRPREILPNVSCEVFHDHFETVHCVWLVIFCSMAAASASEVGRAAYFINLTFYHSKQATFSRCNTETTKMLLPTHARQL